MKVDVVIIGGGASGLMCVIEAAGGRGRRVIVLEHGRQLGRRIAASGGGLCNFTNSSVSPENYICGNKHFVKSALARFTPEDFINLLKKHRISFTEKKNGQYFCTKSSKDVLQVLKRECSKNNVKFIFDAKIKTIIKDSCFHITGNFPDIISESVVIATGGLSYKKLGASDFGYKIAKQFGIKVLPLRPALVPVLFCEADYKRYSGLAGISFNAGVSCNGRAFKEDILFTHKGLSGPAILQISSLWSRGDKILIDIFPDKDIYEIIRLEYHAGKKIELKNLLSKYLSHRFAEVWCDYNFKSRPINFYSADEIKTIAKKLHSWEVVPKDLEGFENAEVTRGGVDTNEVSSKTMESLKVKGLYFVGEVLDVTGELGGYNLHWAWASGWCAGQCV